MILCFKDQFGVHLPCERILHTIVVAHDGVRMGPQVSGSTGTGVGYLISGSLVHFLCKLRFPAHDRDRKGRMLESWKDRRRFCAFWISAWSAVYLRLISCSVIHLVSSERPGGLPFFRRKCIGIASVSKISRS